MLNAALTVENAAPKTGNVEIRRVSRFMPRDPAQVVYRRMLSELDEDQLVSLETDLEYYLAGGEMSKSLCSVLDAGHAAA